jgi:hypothetical protein
MPDTRTWMLVEDRVVPADLLVRREPRADVGAARAAGARARGGVEVGKPVRPEAWVAAPGRIGAPA